MKTPEPARRYAFANFLFDAAAHELRGDEGLLKLRPQVSLVLEMLLLRSGEVVTKGELRQALWPDERVVLFDGSIAVVILELRRALDDDPKAPRFVETIPKRGYRFVQAQADSTEQQHAGDGDAVPDVAGRRIRRIQVMALAVLMLLAGGDRAVRSPTVSGTQPIPVTIAVLPFASLTGQPAHRILSETLALDLVGWLGPIAPDRLRVVGGARGRSKQGAPTDFVVLGSIQNDDDAVIVTARLLTGTDEAFVWSEDYRRIRGDPRLISREVTARIAQRVLPKVLPHRAAGATAAPGIAAAAAYRRGMEALTRRTVEGTVEAVAAFEQATQLAPDFPAAHARLAEALIQWPGPRVTPNRVRRARQSALRALELEADHAVAYRVLGDIHLYFDRDWRLAGSRLERSVELAPADADGHRSYAAWLSARGRHGEALREIDLAEALDAGSVLIRVDAMLLHFYARDFPGAVRAARRLEPLLPDTGLSHRYLVLSRLASGDVSGAAAKARSVLSESGSTPGARKSMTALSDREILDAYWAATFRAISRYVRKESGDLALLALVDVQMGRLDAAIDALELATSEPRFSYLVPFLGVSPAFDRLCGYPRFERILRRLNQSALDRDSAASRCESVIRASRTRLSTG